MADEKTFVVTMNDREVEYNALYYRIIDGDLIFFTSMQKKGSVVNRRKWIDINEKRR